MGLEDSSLIGWALTIVGFALAIIAYAIYLNLRGEKEVKDPESTKDNAPVLDDKSRAAESDQSMDEEGQLSTSQNGDEEPDSGEASGAGSNGRQEKGLETQKSTPLVPEDQELIPIATFLREADTGRIVVRINDEVFSSPAEIKESGNWARVEGLPAEFSNWLIGSPDPSGDEQKAKAEHAAARGKAKEDQGMITEINQIIEHKIRNLEGNQQSVRLVENHTGSLNVLIGVESFPFDDVPYKEILKLIQESVAEWEAKQ